MTLNRPRHSLAGLSILSIALTLYGCESMSPRERGTAGGAAAGALAGAVIGSATGGRAGTGAVIGGVIGAVAGNLWSKSMEEKKAAMERATAGTNVTIARTPDNQLQVSLPNDISFDIGSAALKPELRSVLDQLAQGLDANVLVRVIGHTDSTGGDAVTDPLSLRRAQTVRDYLDTRGVAADRMQIEGRGAREPVADNATEAGRAKNRRVEILLREPQT